MLSYVDSTRAAAPRKSFFSAVPNDLQDDLRLKPRDIQVVASILRYARQKNWASMSNRTLANHGRCGERTIQLSLARLEATGWIRRKSTSADIGSSTGRIIYLAWRSGEMPCAPPASSVAPPPPSSIAPEVEEQKSERKPAPRSLDGSGPGPQTGGDAPTTLLANPPLPAGPPDYVALGWLDRPATDPLRKIAEKALAARLAGPPATASAMKRPSIPGARPPMPPGTLAVRLGRALADRS
jgi:hypothetical protein